MKKLILLQILILLLSVGGVTWASTITTIQSTDTMEASRIIINTNFTNLNTDKIGLSDLSSTATGLTYTTSTGVFSLTSGYNIPLTASTTNWNTAYGIVNASSTIWDRAVYLTVASSTLWSTAYSWGNHALAGYLTSYSDIYWTGTATNLVAATGRTSLGLGTMAVANTSDYLATGTAATTYFTISGANASNTSWLTDTNTTYSASGTLLNLTGTNFSVNAGTLTNTKGCIYTTGTGIVCNSTFLTAYTETDPIWNTASSTFLTTTTAASTYVPYTGATADVDLGNYYLRSNAGVAIASTGGIGWREGEADETWFSFVSDGKLMIMGSGVGAILDVTGLTTADKTFTFPNVSGTFALGTGLAKNLAYWSATNTLAGLVPGSNGLCLIASSTATSGFDFATCGGGSDIYWTGTSTNLVAATGRTSLGLGDSAVLASSTFVKWTDASTTIWNNANFLTTASSTLWSTAYTNASYVSAASSTVWSKSTKATASITIVNATSTTNPKFKKQVAITLTKVSCDSVNGTSSVQLYERTEASPNTGGTALLNAILVCGVSGTASTTSFADSAIAANAIVVASSTTGTAGGSNTDSHFYIDYAF